MNAFTNQPLAASAIPAVTNPLLEVADLRKTFSVGRGLFGRPRAILKAVSGVSLKVYPGEIVGLVGESGSGKTTLGRCVLRLVEPSAGTVRFDGVDLMALTGHQLRAFRKHMQIIFQDPFDSINERMSIGELVGEALAIHRLAKGKARRDRIVELLEQVGLRAEFADRYPHTLSGGQRQRVGIARALAGGPQFLVADEPVSALDLSVQAQILNLLLDIRDRLNVGMLFISHDLSVVRFIADRVLVMYLGKIVESAPAEVLYRSAAHPYTQALLSAAPIVGEGRSRERIRLQGELPSPVDPPSGCVFRTRCPKATSECAAVEPPMRAIGPDHHAACLYPASA
ncbi:ATP-binding cassette domain-containing protein [Sinorhizobium sp. 7-81]|uniref:ABC transporter ATP-binding protein n=1 Tax=Sinorhizobium sp. 8-89 TaxID=3049089 RepID=UPI0024C3A8B9|nr:oligopeptide/dipeptide ABC transporter ATP-binding protein [Sinorhizobium sp. 8-89]MDK1494773.1 ATP-binding cassette domain-containing protein [Sinorhizobium sp. 8-89]